MKRIFAILCLGCLFLTQQAAAGYYGYKGYAYPYKGYSYSYTSYQAISRENCADPFCWPSPPELTQAQCCEVFGNIGAYRKG